MLGFTFYFVGIESIQLREALKHSDTGFTGLIEGIKDYLDPNNIRDVTMAVLQVFLFGYRIIWPIDIDEVNRMTIAILNALMIWIMITKILFYLKVYDQFSVHVNMINEILKELLPFLSIFMLFISFFALSFFVLGGEFDSISPDTLGQMNYAFAAFFNSYEMSTGQEHNVTIKDPKPIQTSMIWGFWLTQQVVMTIILLNFLIALISQKYEEAISKLEITKTTHKAELNAEYFINRL